MVSDSGEWIMAPKKTYRAAVIGRTGRGNYGHGLDKVWTGLDGVELVALADADAAGRKKKADELGVQATYADYRQMLAQERPNLVSIGPRWLDAHHDMVLACAEHGASIFLEKPLCRTLAEADAMVRACEMAHVKLVLAHPTRYSPKIAVVKRLLEEKVLGEVIEFRARGKEDRRGGGEDLWVLGTHLFDLMRLLGGEPKWCFATVRSNGRPITPADVHEGNEGIGPLAGDAVDAMFGFDSGITAYFSSHRDLRGQPSRFALSICGSKGLLEMGTGYLPTTMLLRDSSWSPGRSDKSWVDVSSAGPEKPEPIETHGSHAGTTAMARDLIRSIEEDDQPLGSIYQGRGATEMIVAVFESQRQGGPVKLPLENRKNPLTMLE
jgi:predicted dehydrogenase